MIFCAAIVDLSVIGCRRRALSRSVAGTAEPRTGRIACSDSAFGAFGCAVWYSGRKLVLPDRGISAFAIVVSGVFVLINGISTGITTRIRFRRHS